MIIRTIIFNILFLLIFTNLIFAEEENILRIIQNTEDKFRLINDYEVKMSISVSIPAFRMPKKKYHVFFKQPNKIKIKSKGFGVLPRTGMFTSPKGNFDNLTDMEINHHAENLEENSIMLVGNLIVDSLSIDMPNDYAKLTFKPTVDVVVDTSMWVITGVTTKIDTIKIMEIHNKYGLVNNKYFLPIESKVEYFVKDARFTKWIKKDVGVLIGNKQNVKGDMVKGNITVSYKDYKVNQGISDLLFNK